MKENIFAELYNKLLGLFRQAEEEGNSKDVARNRLRVVLMQDRTNLTPQLLEKMRGELVELLSKYLEMDKDALELNLDQDGEQMALALSIPVIRAKDEEEIEKAIAEEEAKKAEAEEDFTEEESDADEATEEEHIIKEISKQFPNIIFDYNFDDKSIDEIKRISKWLPKYIEKITENKPPEDGARY